MNNFEYHEDWKDPETGRMKKHVYLMDGKQMTGVTTILGVIAKPALIQWAADMACQLIGTAEKDRLGNYVVTNELLKSARTAHTKKKEAAGDKGTDLHSQVEGYIKNIIERYDGVATGSASFDQPMSIGLAQFAKWACDNNIKFLASEKQVYSKDWFVAGTFDFSFEKDGKRFVGDLKTMGKIWDRVPHFQAAAYRKMSVEMGGPDYVGTCIVNISKPTEKYPSELTESWSYDWEGDTKAFESCLYIYRQLNQ